MSQPAGSRVYVDGADSAYWIHAQARDLTIHICKAEEDGVTFVALPTYPPHWGAKAQTIYVRPSAVTQVTPIATKELVKLWRQHYDAMDA